MATGRRFYHEAWLQREQNYMESSIFEELPHQLRAVVAQHQTAALLSEMRVFGALSPEERRIVASKLVPVTLGVGQDICCQGDLADRMWILQEGRALPHLACRVMLYLKSAGLHARPLDDKKRRPALLLGRMGILWTHSAYLWLAFVASLWAHSRYHYLLSKYTTFPALQILAAKAQYLASYRPNVIRPGYSYSPWM